MQNTLKSSILGIFTGIINGLFGSGGGMILVVGLEKILKIDAHKAHASSIAIILPISLVSVFVYMRYLNIDYIPVILISTGGMIGGFIGAKFLNKISTRKLKILFGVFMIFSAIKIILG